MKKTRYTHERLTEAGKLLDEYETDEAYNLRRNDVLALHSLNGFFKALKTAALEAECPVEKQKIIEIFEILTDISFDKLEKDVMGVN